MIEIEGFIDLVQAIVTAIRVEGVIMGTIDQIGARN